METHKEKYSVTELDRKYRDSEQLDKRLFSEMRGNVLLVDGQHYNRKNSNFFERIRANKNLSEESRIRLTKNHTQKIQKIYCNEITNSNPGVGFSPKNENEIQDQKAAEQNKAVWQDAVKRYNMPELIDEWCDDFITLGEVAVKIFWDPDEGQFKGFEQKLNDDGTPKFESLISPVTGKKVDEIKLPTGELIKGPPIADKSLPVFDGGFVFERIFSFNLLRPGFSQDMKKAPWLMVRKLTHKDELLEKFGDDPIKKMAIEGAGNPDMDGKMLIFDAQRGGYRSSEKEEILVKEFYLRPNKQNPEGWFVWWIDGGDNKDGKLAEGPLPGGVFPIITQFFEHSQTNPRGRSIIRAIRPYQVEINRAASKAAEHQITLGDDKIITQYGAKITSGVKLNGIRTVQVSGPPPTILAGRSGEQFLGYMQDQISEMYDVADVESKPVETKKQDPYSLLFMAASKKKKFQRHAARFDRFLVNVAKLYLTLAKVHFSDDMFVKVVGTNEAVNIAEFKRSKDIDFEIVAEPQSDDIETKLGKQLMLNNTIQFVGNKLDKEDIGELLRAMPFSNNEQAFSNFTLNRDSITNAILALDRGEVPQIGEFDDHVFYVKRLAARMGQASFKILSPEIQQNYQSLMTQHQKSEVEKQRKIQAANADFIPTDGVLIGVDVWVRDPKDPTKTKRAKIPNTAVEWLIKRMEDQGQSLEKLEDVGTGALAQMADISQQQKAAAAQGQGAATSGAGAVIPGNGANNESTFRQLAG